MNDHPKSRSGEKGAIAEVFVYTQNDKGGAGEDGGVTPVFLAENQLKKTVHDATTSNPLLSH